MTLFLTRSFHHLFRLYFWLSIGSILGLLFNNSGIIKIWILGAPGWQLQHGIYTANFVDGLIKEYNERTIRRCMPLGILDG
jgi:hypothetical protein